MKNIRLKQRFFLLLIVLFLLVVVSEVILLKVFDVSTNNNNIMPIIIFNIVLAIVFFTIYLAITKWVCVPLFNLKLYLKSSAITMESHLNNNKNVDFSNMAVDLKNIFSLIDVFVLPLKSTFNNLEALSLQSKDSQQALKKSLNSALDTVNSIKTSSTEVKNKLDSEVQTLQSSYQYFDEVIQSMESVMNRIDKNSQAVEKSIYAVEKIFTSFDELYDDIIKANQISKNLVEVADVGKSSVNDTKGAIEEINDASKTVANVVKVISSISEKTKILSLNASIEAANAGTVGRGFSVVAGEIRKLATNSADSITNINKLIESMTNKIVNGVSLSQNAFQSIQHIINDVTNSSAVFETIFTSIKKQEEVIMEVAEDLNIIVEITTELKGFNEQQKNNIDKLLEVSESLKNILPNFQLVLEGYINRISVIEECFEDVRINVLINQVIEHEISTLAETIKLQLSSSI